MDCRAEMKSMTHRGGKLATSAVVEVRRGDGPRIVSGGGCGVADAVATTTPTQPPSAKPPTAAPAKPYLVTTTVINEPRDHRNATPVGWRCEWYVPGGTPAFSATATVMTCAP